MRRSHRDALFFTFIPSFFEKVRRSPFFPVRRADFLPFFSNPFFLSLISFHCRDGRLLLTKFSFLSFQRFLSVMAPFFFFPLPTRLLFWLFFYDDIP